MSRMKLVLDVVQDLRSLAHSILTLCDTFEGENVEASVTNVPEPDVQYPAPVPEPTPEPEHTISLVELRAFVAEKSTPENRPQIRAILNGYGVRKLTELDPEHYSSLMKKVAAI